jgi:hypothetical protein
MVAHQVNGWKMSAPKARKTRTTPPERKPCSRLRTSRISDKKRTKEGGPSLTEPASGWWLGWSSSRPLRRIDLRPQRALLWTIVPVRAPSSIRSLPSAFGPDRGARRTDRAGQGYSGGALPGARKSQYEFRPVAGRQRQGAIGRAVGWFPSTPWPRNPDRAWSTVPPGGGRVWHGDVTPMARCHCQSTYWGQVTEPIGRIGFGVSVKLIGAVAPSWTSSSPPNASAGQKEGPAQQGAKSEGSRQ